MSAREPTAPRSSRRLLRRTTVIAAGLVVAASTALVAPAAYAEVPANDDWDAATEVSSLPFEDTVDTTEATRDDVTPPKLGRSAGNTVWYHLNPDVDGPVLVSTVESDFYHKVTMYQADSASQAPEDWTWVRASHVGFVQTVEEGQDYFLVIGNRLNATGGNVQLVVRDPAEVTFDVGTAKVDRVSGSAVFHGTFTSDQPVAGYLTLSLRQAVGEWVASGGGYEQLDGDPGTVTHWRLVVPTEHPFQTGRARVDQSRLFVYDAGVKMRIQGVIPHVVVLH